MTDQDRYNAIEALESRAYEFVHALTYAKVLARMAVCGKVPDHHTLLEKVDEAIGRWNELANLAPGELRRVGASVSFDDNPDAPGFEYTLNDAGGIIAIVARRTA